MTDHAQLPAGASRAGPSRAQREANADLQAKLAAKQCSHCATVGLWRIHGTIGGVRYIACGACGKCAKVVP